MDWISGEKVFIKSVREALPAYSKEFPPPALSMMTTAADQYCYLLNGWGWMAREAGYASLAVLLDESEHYSLLNARGQERADNFFKGLIYTAMASEPGCRIDEAGLQHQKREHPFRFTERSELLVMFAVTPSANTFDYRRWLNEQQIVTLNGRPSEREMDDLVARFDLLHRQAYAYDRAGQPLDIAEFDGMSGKRIDQSAADDSPRHRDLRSVLRSFRLPRRSGRGGNAPRPNRALMGSKNVLCSVIASGSRRRKSRRAAHPQLQDFAAPPQRRVMSCRDEGHCRGES